MRPKILFSPLSLSHTDHQGVEGGGCDGDGTSSLQDGCDGDGACSRTITLEPLNSFFVSERSPFFLTTIPSQIDCDGCDSGSEEISQILDISIAGFSFGGPLVTRGNVSRHLVPLDGDHYAILSPDSKTALIVLNASAQKILNFFSLPRDPAEWPWDSSIDKLEYRRAITQLYELGLLQDAVANPKPAIYRQNVSPLESWLYLTRACNLDCAHCFVSKDVRRMSLDTGLQAVDRLFTLAEKHGHPQVKIKYAGGEPTMNWDLIPALHQRAKWRAQETGLKLTEILVTNATLLKRERLQFIKDENFRLSISLDGFGEGHDRQRSVRNGNPTFHRVLRSVNLALEMGLSPYLIISITRLNLQEVPEVVAFALEHRLQLNLNFYRPHTLNDPLVAGNEELVRVLRKAFTLIEDNLPDYNFLEGLIDRSNFGAAHRHVCGAGRNYLSIDTDGSVLPCHMLTGYNLPGIPLQMLESPRFDDFHNPSIDQRNGCNTCEWRHWCAGGCPVHAKNILGSSNVSSPYCSVYQAIYPELVRLQALQLIQADQKQI